MAQACEKIDMVGEAVEYAEKAFKENLKRFENYRPLAGEPKSAKATLCNQMIDSAVYLTRLQSKNHYHSDVLKSGQLALKLIKLHCPQGHHAELDLERLIHEAKPIAEELETLRSQVSLQKNQRLIRTYIEETAEEYQQDKRKHVSTTDLEHKYSESLSKAFKSDHCFMHQTQRNR